MLLERLGAMGRILGGGSARPDATGPSLRAAAAPVKDAIVSVAESLDSFMLSTQQELEHSKARFLFESNVSQAAHRALMEMINRLKDI